MSTPTQDPVAFALVGPGPSLAAVIEGVAHSSAGAVATFLGLVRDHDHGEAVRELEYSAHPQAQARLAALAAEIAAYDGVRRVAVHHATGALAVGDIAVVAAVSADHRGQAFDGCRTLVDRLKAEVPIWKHQVFADGRDEWVGCP